MNMIAPHRASARRGRQRHGRHARDRRKSSSAHPDVFDITVFGAEPHGNYNRIMLSPVLAGEKTFDADRHPYPRLVQQQRHRTDRRRGSGLRSTAHARRSSARERHRAALRRAAARHRLEPGHPAAAGRQPAGRHRASATSPTSKRCSPPPRPASSAVVIGGGLLGLEAAQRARRRNGMDVTVVHLMPTPDGAPAGRRCPPDCWARRCGPAASPC